ncbi:hypothetical protein M3C53_02295 [Micrococcus luteus]|nr:hypothetical protein [Micrococcus luteus]
MALKKLPGGVIVETTAGARLNEEAGVNLEAIHRQIVAGVDAQVGQAAEEAVEASAGAFVARDEAVVAAERAGVSAVSAGEAAARAEAAAAMEQAKRPQFADNGDGTITLTTSATITDAGDGTLTIGA